MTIKACPQCGRITPCSCLSNRDRGGHKWRQLKAALKRQTTHCEICGEPIQDGQSVDLDHRIPLEFGGTDDHDNLRIVHTSPCHHRGRGGGRSGPSKKIDERQRSGSWRKKIVPIGQKEDIGHGPLVA